MDDVNRAYTKELGFIVDAICFGAIFLFVSQYFEGFRAQESEYFFYFTGILIISLVAVGYFSRNRFLLAYCAIFAGALFARSLKEVIQKFFPDSFFNSGMGAMFVTCVFIFFALLFAQRHKISEQEKLAYKKDHTAIRPYLFGIILIAIIVWVFMAVYQKV